MAECLVRQFTTRGVCGQGVSWIEFFAYGSPDDGASCGGGSKKQGFVFAPSAMVAAMVFVSHLGKDRLIALADGDGDIDVWYWAEEVADAQ